MGNEHTFYDYIDEDSNNIIEDWLNNEGFNAKAKFINRIELLSASSPGGMEDSVWKPPFVKPLKAGKWKKFKDFLEIRVKAKNNQYRLIGKKLDREIFLVAGGYHDGKGWHTEITPATAQEMVTQMISDPQKYRRNHEI